MTEKQEKKKRTKKTSKPKMINRFGIIAIVIFGLYVMLDFYGSQKYQKTYQKDKFTHIIYEVNRCIYELNKIGKSENFLKLALSKHVVFKELNDTINAYMNIKDDVNIFVIIEKQKAILKNLKTMLSVEPFKSSSNTHLLTIKEISKDIEKTFSRAPILDDIGKQSASFDNLSNNTVINLVVRVSMIVIAIIFGFITLISFVLNTLKSDTSTYIENKIKDSLTDLSREISEKNLSFLLKYYKKNRSFF